MNKQIPLLALSVVLALCPNSLAQEETLPAEEKEYVEPIITEETLPNEVGEWDFRFSIEYAKGPKEERSGLLPRFQVFFGIARNLGGEIDLPLAYTTEPSQAYGVGDAALSLKWLVVEPASRKPAVVLGLEVELPTGDADRELGEGAYEFEPFVALMKDFSQVNLQGSVGFSGRALTSDSPNSEGGKELTYNWAAAFPVHKKRIHLLAEVNGSVSLSGGENAVTLSPGFKYNLGKNMFIGIGTPVGLTRESRDFGVVVQFQVGVEPSDQRERVRRAVRAAP